MEINPFGETPDGKGTCCMTRWGRVGGKVVPVGRVPPKQENPQPYSWKISRIGTLFRPELSGLAYNKGTTTTTTTTTTEETMIKVTRIEQDSTMPQHNTTMELNERSNRNSSKELTITECAQNNNYSIEQLRQHSTCVPESHK